jgi:hypothetical protein
MKTQIVLTDAEGNEKSFRMPLLPAAVSIVELCLLPLLLIMLAFGPLIIRLIVELGFELDLAAKITFLHNQSVYLAGRGVDPASVSAEFQIFALMIWISVAVLVLRLVSGPFLFDFWNARAISLRKRYLPPSLDNVLFGCLIAGPFAVWTTTWTNMAAGPLLRALLKQSPRSYIRLEAFVFIGGLIISVEGLLLILLFLLKRRTSRLFNPYE